MSRIGKKPVSIPKGVTISVANSVVTVKGPKGTLTQEIDRDIEIEITETELIVKRPTEQIRHRAMHGLYRSLISNLVKGVTDG
jgi:large subunit ribosomal protein L6